MIDPISRRLLRGAPPHGPLMLMYHSVQPEGRTPNWPWAVSAASFCKQLDFLQSEGYQTMTMSELAAGQARQAERCVVITFDDGYVDNMAACDALAERGMRASWFIVSGSIGREPDWPADGRPVGRLLDATELRQMHAAGMEIGSHTVSHARLPDLDDGALTRELVDSMAAIEDAVGAPVTSFAYPYGLFDARCEEAVRRSGYTAACTTRTGWAMRDGDPLKLRRLTVFNDDSLSRFARKLHFGSHDVAWSDMARYAMRRLGWAH